ncbi:MAG: CopG family antitoxin [Candidatus Sumerlaeota bacterium]|nr:CopG family antitoxin [Candidatus Sumerlaeota bacterium]
MKRDSRKSTSISKASTDKETGAFWDTHSLADHWDKTQEVSFEVRATRRRRVTIDPDIYNQVESFAHLRGISVETLVNLLLAKRLRAKQKSPQRVARGSRSHALA